MKLQQSLLVKLEKYHQNKKGQFMAEVLLAIIIFLLVFIGFYNLIYSYVKTLNQSKEVFIANFLAQEGLELVRAIRDYRFAINECRKTASGQSDYPFCPEYSTSSWLGDLGNNNTSSITFCLNYDFNTSSCDNPDSLYLNSESFFTHLSSNTTTKFKRFITVTTTLDGINIESATSVKVISTLQFGNKQINLESFIFNLNK
ncbi:MAG: hypothetical protein KatS3mg094_474 [Candidatus Parcubacteria bacterium]|nr:MAG: hypothetical protein KatS3mg094_474 [Candidatus Parcubacteria bacterium]